MKITFGGVVKLIE